MTDDDKALALEAERLRTDRPFAEAVTAIRNATSKALEQSDPSDIPLGIKLRAQIYAIDGLCTEIAAQILRGTPQKKPPVA